MESSSMLYICDMPYPVAISVALGACLVAGYIIDGCRVLYLSFINDWEKEFPMKWDGWLTNHLRLGVTSNVKADDTYYGRSAWEIGKISEAHGKFYVNTKAYWDTLICTNREDAEVISAKLKKMPNKETRDSFTKIIRGNGFPTFIVMCFYILAIAILLALHHHLPLAVYSVASVFAFALISRQVVRLTKRFTIHENDPDAHKSKE